MWVLETLTWVLMQVSGRHFPGPAIPPVLHNLEKKRTTRINLSHWKSPRCPHRHTSSIVGNAVLSQSTAESLQRQTALLQFSCLHPLSFHMHGILKCQQWERRQIPAWSSPLTSSLFTLTVFISPAYSAPTHSICVFVWNNPLPQCSSLTIKKLGTNSKKELPKKIQVTPS